MNQKQKDDRPEIPTSPRKKLDEHEIESMASRGLPPKFIAIRLGCSEGMLNRGRWRKAFLRGRAKLVDALCTKQTEKALNGDSAMLTWLGKVQAGQNDRIEITGEGGGPVQFDHRAYVADIRTGLRAHLSATPAAELPSGNETESGSAGDDTAEESPVEVDVVPPQRIQ